MTAGRADAIRTENRITRLIRSDTGIPVFDARKCPRRSAFRRTVHSRQPSDQRLAWGFRAAGFDTAGARELRATKRREGGRTIQGEGFFGGRFWGRTPQDPRPANPQTKDRPNSATRSSIVLQARTTISIDDSNPPSYRLIASIRKGQHLRRIRHEIVIVLRLAWERTPVNMAI